MLRRPSFSLRARVTAVVAGLSLSALALGFGLLGYFDASNLRAEMVKRGVMRARMAAAYAAPALDGRNEDRAEAILANLESVTHIQFAAVYDLKGELFAAFEDGSKAPLSISPPEGESVALTDHSFDVLTPVVKGDERAGTFFLRTSWAPVRTTMRLYFATAFGILLAVGALAAGLALPLSAAVTRELEESEARYRALFESSPAPLLDQDLSLIKAELDKLRASGVSDLRAYLGERPGEVARLAALARNRDSNVMMREFIGAPTREELRERIGELFSEKLKASFAESLAFFSGGGRHRETEASVRRLDGVEREVFYRVLLVPGHEETWDRFLLTFTDITARKEAERSVVRLNAELAARLAEATAAAKELESFSYSVSHDLRAPLRAIDGFTSIIADKHAAALPEEARALLGRVRARCVQMGELIDSLLALSRLGRQPLNPVEVDLSRLARGAAERLKAEDPGRKVEFKLARGVKARGDEALLGALLENLLGNAWKFTAGVPEARVEFGAEEAEGGRRYFVRDDGPGFEMAHAEQIFLPFRRLHTGQFPGTGVGLAIVERVVIRHGGRVWAESEPGKGATFYFTLEG